MSDVDVKYTKDKGAKQVTITISCAEQLSIMDVLRALSSIMTQLLTTGKY